MYAKCQRCLSKLEGADAPYSHSESALPLLGKKHPNSLGIIVIIAKPAAKLKVVISGQLCSHLNLVFQMFVINYLCPNNTFSDPIHLT